MAKLSKGVRAAAAVSLAGLAWAGPQAAVAAADTGGSGPSAGSREDAARQSEAGPVRAARTETRPRAARVPAALPRSAASTPASSDRGSSPAPRAAATPNRKAATASRVPVVVSVAAPAQTSGQPPAGAPPAPALSLAPTPTPTPVAAAVPSLSAALDQGLTTLAFTAERVLDTVGDWLDRLPANPVTEFLSGALWLLRRSVFPVGAGVGAWGTVACVATKDCRYQDLRGANLSGRDLSGVDFTSSDLTRANLTDATMVRTDLTKTNLTQADLRRAILAYPSTFQTIWSDTTCPNGSASSTGCNGSPGLISSDWLRVDEETGEWTGDEPVLMTVVLQSTLGTAKSTTVAVVPDNPRQLGSGVDAGQSVSIPDATGDLWMGSVRPLTLVDMLTATENGTPVPVPVIVTVGLAYDGDFNTGAGSRLTADLIAEHMRGDIASTLENIKLYVGGGVQSVAVTNPGTGYTSAPKVTADGFVPGIDGRPATLTAAISGGGVSGVTVVDGGAGYLTYQPPTVVISGGGGSGATATVKLDAKADVAKIVAEAVKNLEFAAMPSLSTIARLVWSRIEQWYKAGGDPDDPVGISVSAFIPVDDALLTVLEVSQADAGGFAKVAGLDDQYLKVTTKPVGFGPYTIEIDYFPDITVDFRSNVQIRYGLLVSPEMLSKNEGKTDKAPQSWETVYNGIWSVTGASNDWAKYVVGTQAWPQVTWRA